MRATYKFVVLIAMLLAATLLNAATITSTAAGGRWTQGNSWLGGTAPSATDIAIVATTGTGNMTFNAQPSCAGITVNAGSTLNLLTRVLTVSGNVINNGTITLTTGTITQSATGDFTNNGSITFASGTGILTLHGSLINTGTITLIDRPVTFTGTNVAASTVAGFTTTGLVTYSRTAGSSTFTGNVSAAALTLNASGGTLNLGTALNHTFTGAITITAGTLEGGSSTLHANFLGTAWSRTGVFTAGTGTVDFGGAGNQSIAGTATTFNNLTFSSSGIKTLTTIPTVNGILSMEGTATASTAPNFGAAATIQYKGIDATRTIGVEFPPAFAGTGGVIIDQGGTNTITLNENKTAFNGDIHVQTGKFDLSNFTINRPVAGGTLSLASGTTLRIGGTNTLPSNYTSHSIDAGSTVEYYGSSQTVAGLNSAQGYGNLLLSVSGIKTFASTVADVFGTFTTTGTAVAVPASSIHFGGNFTLGSGTTFTAGSFSHTLDSNFENNGATFNSAGSTFLFNGTVPQSIGGTTSITFENLTLNNATGVTLGIGETVNGTLIIGTGAAVTTGAFSHTIGGNFVNDGSSFDATGSTLTFNGGSAQTIGGTASTSFNNLTLDNASGVTMNGSDIDITSPGTLQLVAGRNLTLENGPLLTIQSGATATTGVGSKIILKSDARYLNLSTSTPTLEVQRQLTGSKGWRMFASPVATSFSDMLKSPLVTQGFTGSSFPTLQPNVLWWLESDGGTTLQSWRAPTNLSDNLTAGRGYFHYLFNGAGRLNLDGSPSGSNYTDVVPTTMTATGVDNFNGTGSYNYSLTYTTKASTQTPSPTDTIYFDLNSLDQGWNLIGNPTASTLDWDAVGWTKTNVDNTIYVWDPSALSGNGDYLTWNGTTGTLGSGRIPPFQAFWAHTTAATTLSFTNAVKTGTTGTFLRSAKDEETISLPITLTVGDLQTTSFLSFSDKGVIGPDRWDGYRLESMSDTWLELYTKSSPSFVSPLVINHLPKLEKDLMDIPLYCSAQINGSGSTNDFTLEWELPANWPSDWIISLQDHQSEKSISMTKQSNYSYNGASSTKISSNNGMSSLPKKILLSSSEKSLLRNASSLSPFTIVISKGTEIEYLAPTPQILGNFPNPFKNTTSIRFSLPQKAKARVEIYTSQGMKVANVANGLYPAGITEVPWDANNLAPGMYFIRFISGDSVETKKAILIN